MERVLESSRNSKKANGAKTAILMSCLLTSVWKLKYLTRIVTVNWGFRLDLLHKIHKKFPNPIPKYNLIVTKLTNSCAHVFLQPNHNKHQPFKPWSLLSSPPLPAVLPHSLLPRLVVRPPLFRDSRTSPVLVSISCYLGIENDEIWFSSNNCFSRLLLFR